MMTKNTYIITATLFFIATNVLPVHASNADRPTLSPLTGAIEHSMRNKKLSIKKNATLNSARPELRHSLISGGLYGTDGKKLYLINKNTGAATLIGPHGPVEFYLGALAFDSEGVLYGISAGDNAQLYTVDPTTGAATPVGPLGIGFVFEGGLCFDADEQLFGVDQGNSAAAKTFTINTATGAATIVGPNQSEERDINGLTFDGETFYAIDRISNTLGTVDPITGSYTPIGYPETTIGVAGGLAHDPEDGTLYATFADTGGFYIVDKASGNATLISINNVDYGLAFAPLPPPTCDGIAVDATGQINIKNWDENRDMAAFKLKGVEDIETAAYEAVTNGTGLLFQFGSCGNPIDSFTAAGNELDVGGNRMVYSDADGNMVRCKFSTEECVVRIRYTSFDGAALNDLLSGVMTVSLQVDETTYTNTGEWQQVDSGSGSWTKYKKAN
ncbi:MAG: hypothetical protein ACL93V_05460 [Candidatus Electrothrix sp. YB6]